MAALFIAWASSGCANVLGLDSGDPLAEDAGVDASDTTDHLAVDASAPATDPVADAAISDLEDAATLADVDATPPDESTPDAGTTPACLPKHAACDHNSDCCSGDCGPGKSGCH